MTRGLFNLLTWRTKFAEIQLGRSYVQKLQKPLRETGRLFCFTRGVLFIHWLSSHSLEFRPAPYESVVRTIR